MKKTLALACLTFSLSANAAIISSDSWAVTGQSGNYDIATTYWWKGSNDPTTAQIDGLMSDGYRAYASSYNSPTNGIDLYNATSNSLTIELDELYTINSLGFWFTRNMNGGRDARLQLWDYGSSSWLSTSMLDLTPLATGGGLNINTLSVNGILADIETDRLRVDFNGAGTAQLILHELVLDGDIAISSVPVPAAAWLFGSALLGLGIIKRKRA